ncbi:MAG: hypothetical protein HQM15_10305 [Deltaproteobacteria bacterium]|nr:hypothetical protein [Deltaproteobacteria bacterium]
MAWNEDYAKADFPGEKRVCLRKSSDPEKGAQIYIRSVDSDEGCDTEEENYQFIKGNKPENSLAFLPFADKSFLKNSSPDNFRNNNAGFKMLYKFTCLGKQNFEILEAKSSRFVFRGELFFSNEKQVCSTAYDTALKACKEQLGGAEVLEKCY